MTLAHEPFCPLPWHDYVSARTVDRSISRRFRHICAAKLRVASHDLIQATEFQCPGRTPVLHPSDVTENLKSLVNHAWLRATLSRAAPPDSSSELAGWLASYRSCSPLAICTHLSVFYFDCFWIFFHKENQVVSFSNLNHSKEHVVIKCKWVKKRCSEFFFLWLTFRVFEMKETFKFGVDSKTAEKGPAQAIFTYKWAYLRLEKCQHWAQSTSRVREVFLL